MELQSEKPMKIIKGTKLSKAIAEDEYQRIVFAQTQAVLEREKLELHFNNSFILEACIEFWSATEN